VVKVYDETKQPLVCKDKNKLKGFHMHFNTHKLGETKISNSKLQKDKERCQQSGQAESLLLAVYDQASTSKVYPGTNSGTSSSFSSLAWTRWHLQKPPASTSPQ
jgi:hypothetical protein